MQEHPISSSPAAAAAGLGSGGGALPVSAAEGHGRIYVAETPVSAAGRAVGLRSMAEPQERWGDDGELHGEAERRWLRHTGGGLLELGAGRVWTRPWLCRCSAGRTGSCSATHVLVFLPHGEEVRGAGWRVVMEVVLGVLCLEGRRCRCWSRR